MKRRQFIHQLAHASAMPALFSSFPFEALTHQANSLLSTTASEGNILIIIVLNGGNDGLNTVIPLTMLSELNKIRSTVMLPENKILHLKGTDLGLHPSLVGLQGLHSENRLKVIQSVGYPNQNYSHFRSMDIWNSGSDALKYINSGWAARYLEEKHPNFPDAYPTELFPHPLAVEIGWNSSLLFTGNRSFTSVVSSNPSDFYEIINEFDNTYPSTPQGEKLKYLQLMAKQANAYGKVLKETFGKGKDFTFPRYGLADQLKIVSKLISGGLNTRIYKVDIGGFDTHGNQVDSADKTKGTHANLLKELDESITAFMKSLDSINKSDRVLGMCISEFGRTVHSNGTNGTDHGSVSPMILFGNKLDTSVGGKNPIIPSNTNYQYEMDMQFDFRQVYGSIINQWMGGGKNFVKEILFNDFDNLQIIKSDFVDSDEDGVPNLVDLCPDTPIGAIVDINGCEIFNLPSNNFKVEVVATTCIGTANGSIKVQVVNTNFTYSIRLIGPNKFEKNSTIPKGTNTSTIAGLILGEYSLVITIEGIKNYQQVFELKISEPSTLVVKSTINYVSQTIQLILSGANQYQVEVNEASYRVNGQQWIGTLPTGAVKIQVKTDLPCQGAYLEEFFQSEEVKAYPNPTSGPLQVQIKGRDYEVNIIVMNLLGNRIFSGNYLVDGDREVKMNLEEFPEGTYLLRVLGNTVDQTIKVVKI
ncbi:DUF1501 domain-containing protein [Aquirufa rosea]|uniref:DUF1501 domain-containing protein n=1 Tax=Aquirufa rosea TaxID=2509241 RepID=A0A4Q1BXR5_9BACT|nr:DUF1501 domain-containing protein [Aquirufa rosea]RXK47194.1 DUF1501 domain-containing protein [Aquirufa rosea]